MRWLNLLTLLSPLTFAWAAVHSFHGTFCIHSYAQAGCGNNPHISYATLAWASAAIFALAVVTALARRR